MQERTRRTDDLILDHVQSIISEFGWTVVELQIDSVAVKGDARQYGPTVVVRVTFDTPGERISEIATMLTNQVPELTRVLVEIPPLNPP